jgi:hypothetical protein
MHSKNLDAYLTQADGINALMPQAKRLLELRHILQEVLPEPLAGFATIANYRQGKIVIFAANSAIAAKLKLMSRTLKDRLVARGLQVTALEIELQPAEAHSVHAARDFSPKAAILTDAARRELSSLAKQLPDSSLKSTISAIAGNNVSKR